jgi:hypothetical protein
MTDVIIVNFDSLPRYPMYIFKWYAILIYIRFIGMSANSFCAAFTFHSKHKSPASMAVENFEIHSEEIKSNFDFSLT